MTRRFAISGWMALEYARIFRHNLFGTLEFLFKRRRRRRRRQDEKKLLEAAKRKTLLTDCEMIFHEGSSFDGGGEPRACTCSHSNLVVCVSRLFH